MASSIVNLQMLQATANLKITTQMDVAVTDYTFQILMSKQSPKLSIDIYVKCQSCQKR